MLYYIDVLFWIYSENALVYGFPDRLFMLGKYGLY